MVLAELVASGELISPEELRPSDGNVLLPLRLEGQVLSPGMALGTAVLHAPELRLQQLVAEDPDLEIDRLHQAVADMRIAIDEMLASSDLAAGGEHREVLESYRMFAEDKGWVNRMIEAIGTGLTAEAGVQKVQNDMRARMRDVSDPYLRERLSDLDDLANRLQKHLMGGDAVQVVRVLPDDAIVIARNMGPAELLDYDRQKLRGLVLEEGAAASHVAIVARALDIPVLGRCLSLLAKVSEGDSLALDGDHGQLFVRPPEDIQYVFATSLQQRAKLLETYAAVKDLPAVTLDGVGVTLSMNAGLLIDVPQLATTGAAGIGLYRTEIPFMVAHEFPDTRRQADIYRKAIDNAEGKPIVFRTLDIGSDKVLPYWQRAEEENPAMGWRAIRISLDRPALLRQQLRALILAADGRDLRVMFPMVTEVAEFDACRALLDLELQRTRDRGITPPATLQVGAMIEVPSLLWQLDELLDRVDFVSVGSNDLKQFIYAADRATPNVNDRYDILSPAMIRLLRQIAVATKESGKALSLCGEMAGDPIGAMALLCLGYRNLSMTPPAIGRLRMMIRSLHLRQLQDYWPTLDGLPGSALRSSLAAFALDHGVQL
jgi:phosphotransferase system enzyme I (PtsP)